MRGIFNILIILFLFCSFGAYSQFDITNPNKRYRINSGVIESVDSLVTDSLAVDSLAMDSLAVDSLVVDSLTVDSLVVVDSLSMDSLAMADSVEVVDTLRHSRFFKDSLAVSRMAAISVVVPGFSQFYNEQYKKIPILYGTMGLMTWGYLHQNKIYKNYRSQYDAIYINDSRDYERLNPLQTKMIEHNTYRQMFMVGGIATYIYFLSDGLWNYEPTPTNVKIATTLSTFLPGAGQFYNKKYWKVPIVVGGFASLAYVMDWNNRGYQRFKLAYDQVSTGLPDEFDGRYEADYLKNIRDSYRRARDLSIIITVGVYIIQIVDAHVDSHMQDYDVSDDLSFDITPTVEPFLGSSPVYGLNFSLKF